jgi:hypothetical protein
VEIHGSGIFFAAARKLKKEAALEGAHKVIFIT